MKTLYLDCSMGAAGDMLAAALLELYGDRAGFAAEMAAAGIPGTAVSAEDCFRCGVKGTRFRVSVRGEEEGEPSHHHHGEEEEHPHHHHGTCDINAVIDGLRVSEKVRGDVRAVYGLLAAAESAVHGVPVSQVHFHEVGALDAVCDVTAVCLLLEKLAPERICASPVYVGGGTVTCAHGVLPVPAPAAAKLLEGVPIYGGEPKMELCTPTGAALLKYYVNSLGPLPVLRVAASGCGMGAREVPGTLNALRAFLGESGNGDEAVTELACNLDDMTPEDVGFALERLLEAGALDAWTAPIGMKKCRPGVLLSCLCRAADADAVRDAMFRWTTTLGIREYSPARTVLPRAERTAQTEHGPVRVKSAQFGGRTRQKPEYDDLARIARETGVPLSDLRRDLSEAEK